MRQLQWPRGEGGQVRRGEIRIIPDTEKREESFFPLLFSKNPSAPACAAGTGGLLFLPSRGAFGGLEDYAERKSRLVFPFSGRIQETTI